MFVLSVLGEGGGLGRLEEGRSADLADDVFGGFVLGQRE